MSPKYSVPDDHWDEDEPEADDQEQVVQPRTEIRDHEVDVIYTVDPGERGGYGRERYKARIRYDDETGEPYVLFVIEYRWKGNYWRDTTDLDWRDTPLLVRRRIASALPVSDADELTPEHRTIEKGGESRFEKYHKPRIEARSGQEMWATDSLRDAFKSVESAAEQLAGDEPEKHERVEDLRAQLQDTIRAVESEPRSDQDE